LQRTDIATGLGDGVQFVKYTITFADLTTAGLTQTISLPVNPTSTPFIPPATSAPPNVSNFVIPQAGVVLYSKVQHTIPFAGGTIASMTCSVGKLGGSNTFVNGTAFNVFGAAADTTLQEAQAISSGQNTAWGVTVTFVSTVGNVNAATAGSVNIYIAYLDVTSDKA
jgi:hypothetical protein